MIERGKAGSRAGGIAVVDSEVMVARNKSSLTCGSQFDPEKYPIS